MSIFENSLLTVVNVYATVYNMLNNTLMRPRFLSQVARRLQLLKAAAAEIARLKAVR